MAWKRWWRHQMETFSALLTLCVGNSPVAGEFPAQRPVTRSFDVFFDLRLNEWLSKQSWGWWFETPSRSLWRHCQHFPNYGPFVWSTMDSRYKGPVMRSFEIFFYISHNKRSTWRWFDALWSSHGTFHPGPSSKCDQVLFSNISPLSDDLRDLFLIVAHKRNIIN